MRSRKTVLTRTHDTIPTDVTPPGGINQQPLADIAVQSRIVVILVIEPFNDAGRNEADQPRSTVRTVHFDQIHFTVANLSWTVSPDWMKGDRLPPSFPSLQKAHQEI